MSQSQHGMDPHLTWTGFSFPSLPLFSVPSCPSLPPRSFSHCLPVGCCHPVPIHPLLSCLCFACCSGIPSTYKESSLTRKVPHPLPALPGGSMAGGKGEGQVPSGSEGSLLMALPSLPHLHLLSPHLYHLPPPMPPPLPPPGCLPCLQGGGKEGACTLPHTTHTHSLQVTKLGVTVPSLL